MARHPVKTRLSAALYLDSSLKCEQVGTGDSPSRLGSLRPSVSRGVARSRGSSKVRTVGPLPNSPAAIEQTPPAISHNPHAALQWPESIYPHAYRRDRSCLVSG